MHFICVQIWNYLDLDQWPWPAGQHGHDFYFGPYFSGWLAKYHQIVTQNSSWTGLTDQDIKLQVFITWMSYHYIKRLGLGLELGLGLGLRLGPIRGHGTQTTNSEKLTTVFTFYSYLKRYLIIGVNARKLLGSPCVTFCPMWSRYIESNCFFHMGPHLTHLYLRVKVALVKIFHH